MSSIYAPCDFSELLRYVHMTQSELAKAIGYSPASVSNWTTGKRKCPKQMPTRVQKAFPDLPEPIIRNLEETIAINRGSLDMPLPASTDDARTVIRFAHLLETGQITDAQKQEIQTILDR